METEGSFHQSGTQMRIGLACGHVADPSRRAFGAPQDDVFETALRASSRHEVFETARSLSLG
ncbi:hypothetical protein D1F64_16410 [Breoghania sp. L-A4]|nr:hypothetical protein D1F64_16410 [Breoghania sp. L-A4]